MPVDFAASLLVAAGFVLGQNSTGNQSAGEKLFRQEIQPILAGKCLQCHDAEKKKGKLDLGRRDLAIKGGASGPAIVPGKPDDSLIYQKLAAGEMPPQNPLSPEQIAAFKEWIQAGGNYLNEPLSAARKRAGADWWSLQPIRSPGVPKCENQEWVRTPIDAFVVATLSEKGLRPSQPADRRTLIRRATFDLLGLPPTPEEIDEFVKDSASDAYERLIDRLLESPHYGERWGRHWLDAVRFAESHGYETNLLRPGAWPYRDYLIRAFNEDKAYPQFVKEQLAGDAVAGADWLVQSATGFLVGGAHDMVGNATTEGMLQQRMDDLDDMVTAVGSTFLGLTVNCARCHDHKFDPISQQDYYGLQAVLAGVQHSERSIPRPDADRRKRELANVQGELASIEAGLDSLEPPAQPDGPAGRRLPVNAKRNIERFETVTARVVRFSITATNNGTEPCIDELEVYSASEPGRNVALASAGAKLSASSTFPNSSIHKLEHLTDGIYGNSRSWISNEPGKGWVQIELPQPTKIDRIIWGRDREEKYSDRLSTEYQIQVAAEPGTWRSVASSADRLPYSDRKVDQPSSGFATERQRLRQELLEKQSRLRARLSGLQPIMQVYAGTFAEPGSTHVLVRGDPTRKGEVVKPSSLSAIPLVMRLDPNATERERRLALAAWIADPRNPLPARVMANRIWQNHFGQGIVATPSDFGYNGERPSHPDLLNWLALEYIRNGWRLKPLHRMIMLSSTYRQSSRTNPKGMAIDQQNRWLWRMMPHRLEAEAVRDSILAVNGKLDLRAGGPGYNLWEKNTNYVVVFKPKEELGPDELRRMVYQFKPRSQQDPTFGIFDCPDAALARPKRTVSTTALQALNLLNSRFVVTHSQLFADRVARDAGSDPERQVHRAFQLAFGRAPSVAEERAATNLIRTEGAPAFCRALYNANEFLYVD
jgi:mono/diheme cytochrome c family protein